MRVGLGTDRHRLEAGRRMVLGGVDIAAEVGCVAHSDGDVLLHALTDALLGALALGDIGELFPDDDPRWAGADSRVFIGEVLALVRGAGWNVANLDCTLHVQRVKIAPHRMAIRRSVAALMELPLDRVSLKAKTGEKVGPVGRGEAIDAFAVVLLAPAAPSLSAGASAS